MDILKTLKRKLRKEKTALERRLAQVESVLGAVEGIRPRKKLSAAARKRISRAQRKRWAAKKN